MSDVKDKASEIRLREKIESRVAIADDYLELASLLFRRERFEESIDTLRRALEVPFGHVTQASLLTALGWYVYGVSGTTVEPRALGEQALRLTDGTESVEALIAKAKAQYLLAECASRDAPIVSRELAASALSILERLLAVNGLPESENLHEIFLATAGLNGLLGRFEAASRRCRQAFEVASDQDQKLNSLIELGTSYREAGRLDEARNAFTEAILYRDVSPCALFRPYYELGATEKAMGKDAEARAKLRRAIDILQSHPALPRDRLPEILRFHGEISYGLEDMEEAARSFRSAVDQSVETDPLHWNSLLWLAYSQNGLGQDDSARDNATLVKRSLAASDEDRASAEVLLAAIRSRENQN